MWVIAGIMLGINCVCDIQRREIVLSATIIVGIIGLVFRITEQVQAGAMISDRWIGSCISFLMLIAIFCFHNLMGIGDGIAMLSSSFFLETGQFMETMVLAFFVVGCYALILLVIFHKKKESSIPFIPFYAGAYWLVMIGESLCIQ